MEPELFFSTLKRRVKKEWIICFCSAVGFGIAAHIYKFLNFLPNWDSLLNLYSSQNKSELGRCFLSVGCLLGSYYDLPWINGVLSLLYLALSAVCIIILFDVKKTLPLIFIGGMVTTFPTVTSTMSYLYLADGFFLSMLCMCVAVVLISKTSAAGCSPSAHSDVLPTAKRQTGARDNTSTSNLKRSLRAILPAALLCAFSLGLYQAYLTFYLTLVVIFLLWRLLFSKDSIKELFRLALRFAVSIFSGLLLYLLSFQLILTFSTKELSQYLGISNTYSLKMLRPLTSAKHAVLDFFHYFFDFSNGVNLFLVLNVVLFLLLAVLFLEAFRVQKLWDKENRARLLLSLLCIACVPFTAYALYFTNSALRSHNLMVMGLCMVYLLPALFYESMPVDARRFSCLKRWSIVLLSFLTLYNFILLANISYQKLEIAYEKSFGVAIRLADRIEQLPEAENCDKIAVFGSLPDSEPTAVYFPPNMTGVTDGYILRKQDASMGENVPQAMLRDYCGLSYGDTTQDDKDRIAQTTQYQEMPCWPKAGSVAVFGDTLVIKFSEESGN